MPIGLIVNEFVTNSFKHAFRNGRGRLTVALAGHAERTARLELADDGPGLPAQGECKGLGLQLIPALVQQIGGEVDWSPERGTQLTMLFDVG